MDKKRKGLIAALVVGLLSGPAIALGISGFTGDAAEASALATPAAVAVSAEAATTTSSSTSTTAADDLATACTIDGPGLVASETDGTINDVEQAALDALRDICAEAGLPLGEAAADEIATETIVVRTVTVSAAPSGGDDYDDDDHDEYEHEDEDDYDDDDHDEYEHEDDDEHEDDGEDD